MAGEQHEQLEMDVLLVGAGPASLAAAYQLAKCAKEHDDAIDKGIKQGKKLGELNIAVIEKTRDVGDAILSGAIMVPRAMDELMPDWRQKGAPVEAVIDDPGAFWFTKNGAIRFPVTPPPLSDRGGLSISLSKFTRWFRGIVEGMGVNIFTEFSGRELLYDGERVLGVRTGDKGISKKGEKKPNFEPGVEIVAKVTVLGEGPRGSLTRDHIWRQKLDHGKNPAIFATGVKEVWEIPDGRFPKGAAYYTMGFPQDKGFIGGGWLYSMGGNQISIGYVTWLSYADPLQNPHENFQRWKTHPYLRKVLDGGKMVQYGAKTVNVGGYYSIPKMYGDGWMLVGESANLVDGQKLKGIHLAIKSGQLAGDVAFEALLKGDSSAATLKAYEDAFEKSWMKEELWESRNFHQAFDSGFWPGMVRGGLQFLLGGRDVLGDKLAAHSDVSHMKKIPEFYGGSEGKHETLKFDGHYLFDKLQDVYLAGSIHEEDQPSHLVVKNTNICVSPCTEEYGNPCVQFCPAAVYEMDGSSAARHHKINASNCVHCKTCDLMDPYDNIRWVTPEGGGGPRYTIL